MSCVYWLYGARLLNRAIQSEVLIPLSIWLLSDRIRDGETAEQNSYHSQPR